MARANASLWTKEAMFTVSVRTTVILNFSEANIVIITGESLRFILFTLH